MITGDRVYKNLMDFSLLLQECDKMISLYGFLVSVRSDLPGLIELNNRIVDLKQKIETLSSIKI